MLETIVSLFIVIIVFSCVASKGKFDNNIYKDIESDCFIYEIHDFLTYAKLRSRQECSPSKIIVDPEENKIYCQFSKPSIMKSIEVPRSMKIVSVRTVFPIDEEGRINKSDTIKLQNYFNELKKITIRVGVDYININGN